ncbi:DUF2236 domain-containing protein [Rhodococcus triatomae]|uniref:Uncharacterized conserved protein, DUF2236 family n=1 Tax=Rhodococcus triatomae TaxID=300028 RepID=A0A1G8H4E7_9NOCA|nr:oxygenase MpaB family protein [Rhodococcus triatomae]QNG20212.1 DUF2236 domain-containing protein [Rhodococcus triatomae]QNG23873.1 DUF2236 domain-containing protein [Rhodococcus triatomae]SDI01439.1 Uncharacterized conserved protein, DUF2236 family [Rhodococcus triatomae]
MSAPQDTSEQFMPVLDGVGLVAGAANVIMQLGRPAVGYGVYESRVESGRLFDHPVKRTRTTLTYLAVAARGSDEEKAQYRKAVNRSHAQVRSTADSPVEYNAFDKDLQLWVAACLYRGFEDVHTAMHGPMDPADRETAYQLGSTFGTTLQMPRDMWPADREAFEKYWDAALDEVHIDDTIREHLLSVARVEFFGPVVSRLFSRINLFFTTGFLHEHFREQMRLEWTAKDQKRFDRIMRATGAVSRRLPIPVRELPYRLLLRDVRRRIAAGKPLV